jgi:hypothetical protein
VPVSGVVDLDRGDVRTTEDRTVLIDAAGDVIGECDQPLRGGYMLDAKGPFYKVGILQQNPESLTVEVWRPSGEGWYDRIVITMPKQPELSRQQPKAMINALGVDDGGNLYFESLEGQAVEGSFLKFDRKGVLLSSASVKSLGIDDTGISDLFDCEGYQVTPDGDILAMYPVRAEFRIVRIRL